MSDLDDIVNEFLAESEEALVLFESSMLAIEAGQLQPAINEAFRAIHTIKGAAPMFGFKRLGRLTHVGEDALGTLRDGTRKCSPAIVEALLALGDAMKQMMLFIRANGNESEESYEKLSETLQAIANGTDAPAVVAEQAAPVPTPVPSAVPAPTITPAPEALPVQAQASQNASSIRVEVSLLDALMNVAGELVLARNHIAQHARVLGSPELNRSTSRLSQLCSHLQDLVMKTRMQPVKHAWVNIPRLVREVSTVCHKQVELTMKGEDTELDKSVIEAIRDPLMHLIRNAIDHGIEAPAQRVQARKPVKGKLSLSARHEHGQAVIEIRDDGRGVDTKRVAEKALAKGLVSAEQLERMSEGDLVRLIFLPGFSTAEAVSSVSGRGVGMDVVKTNIEKIGGSVQIVSNFGVGTTILVRIPLTLAIEQAIIVAEQEQRYAVPRAAVIELVRLRRNDAGQLPIERLQGAPMMRLRDSLLPLIALGSVLGRESALEEAEREREVLNVVVLEVAGGRIGLVVDKVEDTLEIVVKPLGQLLEHVRAFAGATVMGDGSIALILDTGSLGAHARPVDDEGSASSLLKPQDSLGRYLLFRFMERQFALETDAVCRIDQVGRADILDRDGELSVRLGNEVLPVTGPLGVGGYRPEEERLPVITCSVAGRRVALLANKITDCISTVDKPKPPPRAGQPPLLQVGDELVDLIELDSIGG